jgi:hypothetical protein
MSGSFSRRSRVDLSPTSIRVLGILGEKESKPIRIFSDQIRNVSDISVDGTLQVKKKQRSR